jgi:hypothetical protein
MRDTRDSLIQDCGAAAMAADDAVAWLSQNADYVGVRQKSLKRDFMRWGLALSRLKRSAERPPSIAVFGPSQAGKSYLSSALLGSEAAPMKIKLGTAEHDFLDDINPGKNQVETTGLVTRFTMHPIPAAPAGFPVYLRLLTQTDLVKIFANTYFLDFDPKAEIELRDEDISVVLTELERLAAPQPLDTLAAVDVDDIRNYVESAFERRPTVDALLKANFWERFIELAPRLSIEHRVRGFHFLWGGLEEFSRAYIRLYEVLKRLGFAQEVHCAAEALLPRDSTVLDVAQLGQLMADNQSDVAVQAAGSAVRIPRPQLSAVVAELVMEVKAAKWPFLEHTDLLDFPGARSREVNKDPVNDVKDLEKVGREFFRRGKVAYLFDRYRTDNDMTCMLLCLEPGNQNVRTLTDVVNSWVYTSLGDTPKKRTRVNTTLFFVFTKFDTHFREATGIEIGTDLRWTTAIEPPLIDMFARGRDPWPLEWVPESPFSNCYWLRNPGWPAHDIIRYEGKVEVGYVDRVRQGRKPLDELKVVYMQNALVQRHFSNPAAAWDAALSLNDGGIGFIAAALEPVCRPEVKLAVIVAKLSDSRRQMYEALREFYVAEDEAEAERKKRRERATVAVREFRHVVERARFGHFLSEMQIDVGAILLRLRRRSTLPPDSAAVKPSVDYDEMLDWLGLAQTPALSAPSETPPQFRDLANSVMEYWNERMREIPKQERLLSHLGLDPKTAEVIIQELLDGAVRQGLPARIAKIIAENRPPIDTDPQAAYRPARSACDLINGFVVRMGYDAMKPADRPQIADKTTGRSIPIFQPSPMPDRKEGIALPGPERKSRMVVDWLKAFLDLVQKNSELSGNRRVDPAQNERLGGVLQVLSR